jgi:thiamine transporter
MLGGIYIIQGKTFDNAFLSTMGPIIQVTLDYILAYFVVGFAGAFAKLYKNGETMGTKLLWIVVGTVVGGLLKFLCHFVAGYFWLNNYGEFAGIADTSMLYSFVYNATYCIPNVILCTAITVVLARFAPFLLDPEAKAKDLDEEEEKKEEENDGIQNA